MNILLLGKDGQVGRELTKSLSDLGQLTALGRAQLDLSDILKLEAILMQIKPHLIVNASAYTAVDKAESHPIEAYLINENVVAQLASYARQQGAIFVHYSTDYVFDGSKKGAYLENDEVNPLNVYGASKRAGEQAIVDSQCQGYIFRTSWVYSLHGANFIKTILNLAKQKDSLSIVSDQQGVPTSAELIADVTLAAIRAIGRKKFTPGIYHLTPGGITTWYDLACYIVTQLLNKGIDLQLQPFKIKPIVSDMYPLPAKRPQNSLLNHSKLSTMLGVIMPDWHEHVDKFIIQVIQKEFS